MCAWLQYCRCRAYSGAWTAAEGRRNKNGLQNRFRLGRAGVTVFPVVFFHYPCDRIVDNPIAFIADDKVEQVLGSGNRGGHGVWASGGTYGFRGLDGVANREFGGDHGLLIAQFVAQLRGRPLLLGKRILDVLEESRDFFLNRGGMGHDQNFSGGVIGQSGSRRFRPWPRFPARLLPELSRKSTCPGSGQLQGVTADRFCRSIP